VIGALVHPDLRGYRALWYYLAGTAAEQASNYALEDGFNLAREYYKRAKQTGVGIPWLVKLANRRIPGEKLDERGDEVTMLQVERLEQNFAKLGTLHDRGFSAREREIREGLRASGTFEQAQKALGDHLGFIAGKIERDASPDPWWIIGDRCIVFEDHVDAKPSGATIDATKARQAASHPDWMKANVPEAAGAKIISVLVTAARHATEGAMPSLGRVSYWDLEEFRQWAETVLVALRELRGAGFEAGDLDWRARAGAKLISVRADAFGLFAYLENEVATKHLKQS
jgi:hypothetical protein